MNPDPIPKIACSAGSAVFPPVSGCGSPDRTSKYMGIPSPRSGPLAGKLPGKTAGLFSGWGLAKVAAGLSLILMLASARHASAYAIAGGTAQNPATDAGQAVASSGPAWQDVWSNLPFKNFVRDLMAVSGTQIVASATTQIHIPTPDPHAGTLGDLWNKIDSWGAAHVGFRISGVVSAIFGFLSYLLGAAKSAVDWLAKLVP